MPRRAASALLALAALGAAGCGARSAAGEGPALSVAAELAPGEATIGDLVTWRVTVSHPRGAEVELAAPEELPEGLGVVETRVERRRGWPWGRGELERRMVLRADEVGGFELPSPVASLAAAPAARAGAAGEPPAGSGEPPLESVTGPALTLTVVSVLPPGAGADDLRDLKPLEPVAPPWPWAWIAAAVLALAAAAGVAWWLGRRRREAPRAAAPPVPPHEAALAELAALRELIAADPEALRRFHFRVSETVRAYVEGRFGLNATDLTTEEIVPSLARLAELDGGARSELVRMLRDADRVKFARHRAEVAEAEATWERARRFVFDTRPPRPEEREAA